MPFVVVLVNWGINLLMLMIFIVSILSWFRSDPRQPVIKLLHAVVDPLLHPIRLVLPATSGVDFSPMVAVMILMLLKKLLVSGISR